MRQYQTIKRSYPHALVLFRLGDFYELFYEDAEKAARLLDTTERIINYKVRKYEIDCGRFRK